MTRRRTLADARRWCTLWVLADGEPRTIDEIVYLNDDYTVPSREIRREIVRSLEEQGLVTVDRTRRPMVIQLVPHPDLAMEDA